MNMSTPRSEETLPCFIASLPIELLLTILEFNRKRWSRDISQTPNIVFAEYSLVCSAWRPLAQKILFAEVHLGSETVAIQFLDSLMNNKLLGNAVKILSICESIVRPPTVYLSQQITAHCPRVYQINLDATDKISGSDLINLFDPRTFGTLQALCFTLSSNTQDDGSAYREPMALRDVLIFIGRFASLSHLSLRQPFQPLKPSLHFYPPPPPSFHLYELYIEDETHAPRLIYSVVMNWLLKSPAFDRLQVLGIHEITVDVQTYETWKPFLESHGEGLKSLCLWQSSDALLQHGAPIFKVCPNLQEIILPNSTLPSPVRAILPLANVEHLDFGLCEIVPIGDGFFAETGAIKSEKDMKATIDWIVSLPKIRHVTVRYSSVSMQGPMEHLWERCSDFGIQVEYVDRAHDELVERHDPIRMSHFPRGRGLPNMKYMGLRGGTKENLVKQI
ncbi:hypothetical protein FRC03_000536 [Tulasnella sp. 419]|nr:hypothetical protein FRC03_000536 [Tulasnella sp. 419]